MATGILKQILTKRRLKWTGLVLSILLIGAFAASGKYVTKGGFTINTGGVDSVSIAISRGGATLEFGRSLREATYDKFIWFGWRTNETYGIKTRPHAWASNTAGGLPNYGYLFVPLWIPIAMIAPWTAYRWWKERAPPPGLCRKCRYDLAGIGAGLCPECGTAPLTAPEAARHHRTTRRVEAILIGLVLGTLAGWGARRFSFDGSSALVAAVGGVCGGFTGGLLGSLITGFVRTLVQRVRRTRTTHED